MEGNSLFVGSETIIFVYYDFRMCIKKKWFGTCGINDFKKCMKTIKWACSDDPDRMTVAISAVHDILKYDCDMVQAADKKKAVIQKYRKEFPVYEF